MGNRDNKGRFIKGNKAAKGKERPEILREMRHDTKEEVYKCAHSLLRPWGTLKEELEGQDATRLEYLTGKAIANKNYRFIQWLIESVIGRPTQTIDAKNEEINKTFILNYKNPKGD